jgi:hypothetical protein
MTIDELAAKLAADMGYGYGCGEGSVVLPNGGTVRVKAEPDYDTRIDDFECYGKLAPVEASRYDNDAPRPFGFDGSAVKIKADGYHTTIDYWWQPDFEAWGLSRAEWHSDPERRRREVEAVVELLRWGFAVLVVEYVDRCDCCGCSAVRAFEAVGGVEPHASAADVADLLGDMLRQVLPDGWEG